MKFFWFNLFFVAMTCISSISAFAKTCFFVNSYHPGFEWSDGEERGFDKLIKGHCEVKKFYLNAKKVPDPVVIKAEVLKIKALIDKLKPDLVVTADDDAISYLLVTHYKNSKIPFIFCGPNWTISQYNLPFDNTTGMIEVFPLAALVQEFRKSVKGGKKLGFVAADTISPRKDSEYVQNLILKLGIETKVWLVKDMAEWKTAYAEAQETMDGVLFHSWAGIKDWNEAEGKEFISKHLKKITFSTFEYMTPFSVATIAKRAEEQGEYSANAAIKILNGNSPRSIPIISNQDAVREVNTTLLEISSVKPSAEFLSIAKKVSGKTEAK